MEKQTLRETFLEMFGGTEVQRGIKLGILAALLTLFILFGAGAVLNRSANTVNLDTGQIAPLVIDFATGFLTLFVGILLAFYSGQNAPEVKSGDAGKAGLLSGAITMVIFWAGQTIYGLVNAAQSSTGVLLNSFLQTALLHLVAFFVFGGLFGWWGARSAARRARPILSSSSGQALSSVPGTTLSILSAGSPAQGSRTTPMGETAYYGETIPASEGEALETAKTMDEQEHAGN